MTAGPSDEAAIMAKAGNLMDLGRYAAARETLAPLLARPTSNAQAWCLVGSCEIRLNEPQRALRAAEYALTLDPDSEWAHRVRSASLLRLGRRRESIEAALEAVRMHPRSSYGYACLAEAYAGNNQTAKARGAIDEALRLAPFQAEHHFQAGVLSQRLARYADAEAAYRRALELDPGFAAARNNLGVVALKQGRSVEATGHFVGSVRADPTSHLASGNVVVGARAFLVKLSRLTVAALTLGVVLWLVSQTALGGPAFRVVRAMVGIGSVLAVLLIGRRGARSLPAGVARQAAKSPRLAAVLLVTLGGLVGCLYFAVAPAPPSMHSVPGLTVLRLLGLANVVVFISNARTRSGRGG
ncbi:MAG TPA: tetratricopeptide repeat protein [Actinomycetes bacterium]